MDEWLYFDSIKEHRGSYFVEYRPPSGDCTFAIMTLVFLGPVDLAKVVHSMETELKTWLSRYPVPLMIFAYDEAENMIAPKSETETCLVGWKIPDSDEIRQSWTLDDLTKFLESAPLHPDWRTVYSDVPFRTDAQVKANTRKQLDEQRKGFRVLKVILLLWLAVIPATFAVIEFLGPQWLGVIVLVYSLWKAWRAGREIWGHSKPPPSEIAASEKKQKWIITIITASKTPKDLHV